MLWWCKSKKFGTVGKYPLELQGVNTPCKQMNPNLSSFGHDERAKQNENCG